MNVNRRLYISLGALFILIFIGLIFVNIFMIDDKHHVDRTPVSNAHLESAKFEVEIEEDGDININGQEVFDPEDVAKSMIIKHVVKGSKEPKATIKVTPNSVELSQKRVGKVVSDTDGAKKVMFKDNPDAAKPVNKSFKAEPKTKPKEVKAPSGTYPKEKETTTSTKKTTTK